MKRVQCAFHESQHYGRDAFCEGLKRHGFQWCTEVADPQPEDVLLIWNRGPNNTAIADRWERAGARVLVAENGYLGKKWGGQQWYALALGHHNGGGQWHKGGPERWAHLGAALRPWRHDGHEIVVLAQRGIGEVGVAQPPGWVEAICAMQWAWPLRVRMHPGKDEGLPLHVDLQDAHLAITWASGAAIKAIIMGVPVVYAYEKWIGASAATEIARCSILNVDSAARLKMLEALAWAQWSRSEVAAGIPFQYLL